MKCLCAEVDKLLAYFSSHINITISKVTHKHILFRNKQKKKHSSHSAEVKYTFYLNVGMIEGSDVKIKKKLYAINLPYKNVLSDSSISCTQMKSSRLQIHSIFGHSSLKFHYYVINEVKI